MGRPNSSLIFDTAHGHEPNHSSRKLPLSRHWFRMPCHATSVSGLGYPNGGLGQAWLEPAPGAPVIVQRQSVSEKAD